MDSETREKITKSANLAWEIWQLKLRPGVNIRYLASAIKLLDVLAHGGGTLEAIAEEMGWNPHTVSEYISCLKSGKLDIRESRTRSRGQKTGCLEVIYFLETHNERE